MHEAADEVKVIRQTAREWSDSKTLDAVRSVFDAGLVRFGCEQRAIR